MSDFSTETDPLGAVRARRTETKDNRTGRIELLSRMLAVEPALKRRARRLGLSRQDAQDVVQECMCRALEQGPACEFVEQWLYTVVRHLAIDAHRTFKRREEIVKRWWNPPTENTIRRVEDGALVGHLLVKIGRLPEKQRAVLLAITNGEKLGGYATRHRITYRSAEGHLARARERLRAWN